MVQRLGESKRVWMIGNDTTPSEGNRLGFLIPFLIPTVMRVGRIFSSILPNLPKDRGANIDAHLIRQLVWGQN
jgi:hypothetical protein